MACFACLLHTSNICVRSTAIAVNTSNTIPFKTYLLISRRKMSLIICYLASSFTSFCIIIISFITVLEWMLRLFHSHFSRLRCMTFISTQTQMFSCIFLSNSIYQPIEISSCSPDGHSQNVWGEGGRTWTNSGKWRSKNHSHSLVKMKETLKEERSGAEMHSKIAKINSNEELIKYLSVLYMYANISWIDRSKNLTEWYNTRCRRSSANIHDIFD